MIVGGYIVKGVMLAAGQARAFRRQNGDFERVEPNQFQVVPLEVSMSNRMAGPPDNAQPLLPICDDTAAASAIYLAMQSIPASSERQSNVLLPELEAQAAAEKRRTDSGEV